MVLGGRDNALYVNSGRVVCLFAVCFSQILRKQLFALETVFFFYLLF